MLRNPKLLSSRRAYEFAPDMLRLTTLSIKPVMDALKDAFSFQVMLIGSPLPIFGDVPATIPPGVVFNYGFFNLGVDAPVPIRFLHFESARITVDVAGPTSACAGVFELIERSMRDMRAADGSPVIGTPARTLDGSEYSFELGVDSTSLILPDIRDLAQGLFLGQPGAQDGAQLIVSLRMHFQMPDAPFPGSAQNPDPFGLHLEYRAKTKPEDHHYFSYAPADNETHLAYLHRLGDLLSKEEPT